MIGATTHPASSCGRPSLDDDRQIQARIKAEYEEMPGLRLTLPQAARLFGLEPARCAQVLEWLLVEGVIWTNGREFIGRSTGRHRV